MKINQRRTGRGLGIGLSLSLIAGAAAQTTILASLAFNGAQGNGPSPVVGARISGNGQFVAFRSEANNLVPGDTNGVADVFVRDLTSGITTRVSVDSTGAQCTGGDSNNPDISDDGRFVSYTSSSNGLVALPSTGGSSTDGVTQVYLHDRLTGQTRIVSLASDGISWGNDFSNSSSVWSSGDDVKVAFRSTASNLVSNDLNGQGDVFVRDMTASATILASVATTGWAGNGDSGLTQTAISADGSTVGFSSTASNLVASDTNGAASDVFIRNLNTGVTTLVSKATNGLQGASGSFSVALSANGRIVAFTSYNGLVSNDTNGVLDVFVRDTNTNQTTRVSIASGASGAQGNGASGNSNGWGIAISGDGMRVAFHSLATNLTKKDTNGFEDVFLRNRSNNTTVMVSVTPSGGLANGTSGGLNQGGVSMSANGQFVSFSSLATNLVSGDANGFMDVFRRGPY